MASPTSSRRDASLAELEYRVVKSLGVGAGSTIVLIADAKTGLKYALKVVNRSGPSDDIYVTQALHEFEVSQRLAHPNLIRIFDSRQRRKWFRLISVELLMEYIDGQNLDAVQFSSLNRLLKVFIQVAAGLEHMHGKGVYHGDLKPSNILVTEQYEVKIIDYGTAWIRGQPKDRVQGTLEYMAPEQASARTVDERTDLYNFGATLYRKLTNHHANLGGMPHDIDGQLMHWARPKPPSSITRGIPASLSQLTMACLEPTPDRRPRHIATVREQHTAIRAELLSPDPRRADNGRRRES